MTQFSDSEGSDESLESEESEFTERVKMAEEINIE